MELPCRNRTLSHLPLLTKYEIRYYISKIIINYFLFFFWFLQRTRFRRRYDGRNLLRHVFHLYQNVLLYGARSPILRDALLLRFHRADGTGFHILLPARDRGQTSRRSRKIFYQEESLPYLIIVYFIRTISNYNYNTQYPKNVHF